MGGLIHQVPAREVVTRLLEQPRDGGVRGVADHVERVVGVPAGVVLLHHGKVLLHDLVVLARRVVRAEQSVPEALNDTIWLSMVGSVTS